MSGASQRGAAVTFPSDEAARRLIRESLDESLLVEAAAGTGKTSELVRRMVAILQKGKTGVDRVAAVTFTRKAAGELKLRLRQELDKARWETTLPEEIEHLERAAARLEEARIGTIHSFCADLLRERPVEARVDPAFQELDENEARSLFERAFRRWMEIKLENLPAGLRRALSRTQAAERFQRDSPLGKILNAAWRLVEWRDLSKPWRRQPFERESRIDHLVEEILQLAKISSQCPDPTDPLRMSLQSARDLGNWIWRSEREKPRDYDRLEGKLLDLLSALNRQENKKKGTGAFLPGVARSQVVERREQLKSALEDFRREADADLAALLQEELKEAASRYEDLKQSSGRLDFVDLLVRVRDLLRHNAEVRDYFQRRFTHLFVDEFQDTDPLQAEILLLLASRDPAESRWERVEPVPGKLFLVGDPKQSIYRFRRADVLLYQQVKEVLEAAGVRVAYLTRSFRAVRPLQQLVNAAFEPEMKSDATSGQPDYVPLEEFRPVPEGQPSVVALPAPLAWGSRGTRVDLIEESFPEAGAAFIEWLLQENGWKVANPEKPQESVDILPHHICLLFRRFMSWGRDMTLPYTRALEARGIAHVLVGSRSFHRREEVETLRAALNAVEWPDDELSVFATLKGSLFALPDAVLLRFRHEVGSLHPFRSRPEETGLGFRDVFEALDLLAKLHRRRNRRPIVETINALLEATRAHAGFALRPAGHQVLANVQRVCDLARSFEVTRGLSFRGFVEFLEQEAESSDSAEAPVLEEGVEGVRLMTVHAAKGLEFPVVVLADMTALLGSFYPDKYVDSRQELAALRILGCAPWDLLDHQEEEVERDRAEGIRLSYVAATRARDLLVVPVVGPEEREARWLEPLNKAVYPPRASWQDSRRATNCPEFGSFSTLDRPAYPNGTPVEVVRPGLHRPRAGDHEVVWWDPSVLRLEVQPDFGLRQKEILAEDPTGQDAGEALERYRFWKQAREEVKASGVQPLFQLRTVTQAAATAGPSEAAAVRVVLLEKAPVRPSGSRFGTLVHTVLRDAGLRAGSGEVLRLVSLHGRLLGATPEEIEWGARAVEAALGHPLVKRAADAARCHRELPVLLRLEEGVLLEGTIDLAYQEDGRWVVVDFKTDADVESSRRRYQQQVEWYVLALSRITGLPAEGWLLGV